MKLTIVTLMFFSSLCFAQTKVGDSVIYDATSTLDHSTATSSKVKWDVLRYELDSKRFVIRIQTGDAIPNWMSLTRAELEPSGSPKSIYERCHAIGGKYETLSVPAGTFKTCHFSKDKTERWVARNIPCADVKSIVVDSENSKLTVTLRAFNCQK